MIFFLIVQLFFLPLIFWPPLGKFELPKVIFFLLISLGAILTLFWQKRSFSLGGNRQTVFWLLWVTTFLISGLVNNRGMAGLVGDQHRHQGIVFFLSLGLWACLISKIGGYHWKKIWIFAGLAVLLETFIVWSEWAGRIVILGTLGNPNLLAGYLAAGLPVVILNLKNSSLIRLFWLVTTPFLIGAVILTGSRVGVLMLVIESLVIFVYGLKTAKKYFFLFIAVVLLLLLGIGATWQEKDQSLFENRWLIWKLGIAAIARQPLLGYGPEGTTLAYDRAFKSMDYRLEDLIIDRAHNIFIDITLSSGVSGLFFFLLWLAEALKQAAGSPYKLAGFMGIIVFAFFQPLGVVHWFYLIFFATSSSSFR